MDALLWQEKSLSLLDQTQYPREEVWYEYKDYRKVLEVLRTPAVSGDAIIAIAGAYAYCLAAIELEGAPDLYQQLTRVKETLLADHPGCRPLADAMSRMDKVWEQYRHSPELIVAFQAMAVTVHRQDVIAARATSREGRDIMPDEAIVVLSCRNVFHSGTQGGPLGVLRGAKAKGRVSKVFLCENRPNLEGSSMVAKELSDLQIPTTLIPDHAAAALMPRRSCDLVLIEGLRMAKNGDLLAGPGTYELAIAAYFHSIPVYATIRMADWDTTIPDGEAFPKADMDPALVSPALWGETLPPEGVDAWCPNYDMLPNYLFNGLMTEKGLVFPPYSETLPEALTRTADKPVLFL